MDKRLTPSLVYTAMPKYLASFHTYIGAHVYDHKCYPITPYMYPPWLLDSVPREKVREANARYIEAAEELWVYSVKEGMFEDAVEQRRGLDIHDGVQREIEQAEELGTNIEFWRVDVDSQDIRHVAENGRTEALWRIKKRER